MAEVPPIDGKSADGGTANSASDAADANTKIPGIDRQLLEFLVCPVTHTTLRYDAAAQELISEVAGLAYPIRDGIPIMLPDEARELKAD